MHRVLRSGVLLRRHNSTNAGVNPPSKSRVASEFNGLVIPSKHELLLSLQSTLDLSSNAELLKPRYRTAHSTSGGPPRGASAHRRDLGNTQQRRFPRPNREGAAASTAQRLDKSHAPRERRPNTPYRKDGYGDSQQRAPRRQSSATTPTARRAPNLDRFQGLDALGQFTVRTQRKGNTRDGRDRPRRGDAPNTFQRARPGARGPPSRRFAKPSAAISHKNGKLTPKKEKQDIKLEEIEQGGEEPKGAALTAPQGPSGDLSEIFGRAKSLPAVAPRREPTHSPVNQTSRVKDRTKYILETFAGDYTRYSPNVAQDYLAVAKELGVTKQAQLALSKNKTLDLNQRETLLRLVSASATSHNKQITRV